MKMNTPELEVVRFGAEDVIATSGDAILKMHYYLADKPELVTEAGSTTLRWPGKLCGYDNRTNQYVALQPVGDDKRFSWAWGAEYPNNQNMFRYIESEGQAGEWYHMNEELVYVKCTDSSHHTLLDTIPLSN